MKKQTIYILGGITVLAVAYYFISKKPIFKISNLNDKIFSTQAEKDAFYSAYSKQFGNAPTAPVYSEINTQYWRYFNSPTKENEGSPMWDKAIIMY